MTKLFGSQFTQIPRRCALLLALLVPISALAETWQLQAGAESTKRGTHGLAFLPIEIWNYAGADEQRDDVTAGTGEGVTMTGFGVGSRHSIRESRCRGYPARSDILHKQLNCASRRANTFHRSEQCDPKFEAPYDLPFSSPSFS
jgi:hypothetical protein